MEVWMRVGIGLGSGYELICPAFKGLSCRRMVLLGVMELAVLSRSKHVTCYQLS
jgi:hypothetical protein